MYVLLEQLPDEKNFARAIMLQTYIDYVEYIRNHGLSQTLLERFGDQRVNETIWFHLGKQPEDWRIYLQPHVEVFDPETGLTFVSSEANVDYAKFELRYRHTGNGVGLILRGKGSKWKKISNGCREIAVVRNVNAFLKKHEISRALLIKGKIKDVELIGVIPKTEAIIKRLTSTSRLGRIMREVRSIQDDRGLYQFE